MSFSFNSRNAGGRNLSFPLTNQFQANASAMYAPPRTPVVYSQSFMMRNQMTESEPMSEYSEMVIPRTRMIPTVSQPTTPRLVRDSPSPLLMTPQGFVSHYNPDQSFSTHGVPSSPAYTKYPSLDVKKTGNSSPVMMKAKKDSLSSRPKGSKLSSNSRRRYFIGSIDQVVRWHKMAKQAELYALYEVTAVLESISPSPSGVYRMILHSQQKNTKPLQAVFFPIDRDLPKLQPGQLITCVGRMVGTNKLQVYDIWLTPMDNLVALKRISFLCQRTLQETTFTIAEP